MADCDSDCLSDRTCLRRIHLSQAYTFGGTKPVNRFGRWSLGDLDISRYSTPCWGNLSGLSAYRDTSAGRRWIGQIKISLELVTADILFSVVPLFLVYQIFVPISCLTGMAAVGWRRGLCFLAVAAIMAGLVGSANNPIRGSRVPRLISALLWAARWVPTRTRAGGGHCHRRRRLAVGAIAGDI